MLLPMFEASLRAVLSTQLPAVMKCEVREDCAGIAQERPHEANQKQHRREKKRDDEEAEPGMSEK